MRLAPAALIVIAAGLVTGCGERDFTATELVDAVNEHGAQLVLGEPVTTNEAGEEVYTVRSTATGAEPNPQLEGGGGQGALVVADDAGSAADEFDRCESAADLTCFRVANVVLRFSALDAPDQARISGAVSALASEG
ncbi:MAG TPA: hypothetical protein VFH44_09135 [Solirubrobacterales bacterium]|nr:hypothetical protein [Solirubrobacterales bacterium]